MGKYDKPDHHFNQTENEMLKGACGVAPQKATILVEYVKYNKI